MNVKLIGMGGLVDGRLLSLVHIRLSYNAGPSKVTPGEESIRSYTGCIWCMGFYSCVVAILFAPLFGCMAFTSDTHRLRPILYGHGLLIAVHSEMAFIMA